MRPRWNLLLATAVLLPLAACAPQREFSAPAPAGALRCAVEEAEARGYFVQEGGVETGSVRLGQIPPGTPERGPEETAEPELGEVATTDYSEIPIESQLRVWEADGRLHVEILSRRPQTVVAEIGGDVEDHARNLLLLCGAAQG